MKGSGKYFILKSPNLLIQVLVYLLLMHSFDAASQPTRDGSGLAVIAYYSGNSKAIDQYDVKKLTHIIYSFCHLKGNRLSVDNAADSATIQRLVSIKERQPGLKVLLSLGGWGGCEYCSPVFASETGRMEFVQSVKMLNDYFGTDGIDLDWEYPAIEGFPGHAYKSTDRGNFTALVTELRKELGEKEIISFAAGGFNEYLKKSIDWRAVMPLVNYVNLMSYDLTNGFSLTTGHHTPLYSSIFQVESADNAIRYLLSQEVPSEKIVIGAAFYARTWERVGPANNGLYQPGKFKSFIPYREFDKRLSAQQGFEFFLDSTTYATYVYNKSARLFGTFDDERSIMEKTRYAIEKGLGGIMFWELTLDKTGNGLLEVIDNTRRNF